MAKNNSDEPRTLEIRKYQNRRYYGSPRSMLAPPHIRPSTDKDAAAV
jgi:hypothetical protein